MSSSDQKRRAVLKSVGTIGALALGPGTTSALQEIVDATDKETLGQIREVVENFESLQGRARGQAIRNAAGGYEFQKLWQVVRQRHPSLSLRGPEAYRSEELGSEFVVFPLEQNRTETRGEIVISVASPHLQPDEEFQGAKVPTKASITTATSTEVQSHDEYILESPGTLDSIRMQGVEVKSLDQGGDELYHIHMDPSKAFAPAPAPSDNTGTVGILSSPPAESMPLDCGQCKTLVGALNTLSCSLSSAALCSVITAKTGIGPLACVAGVGLSCWFMTNYGTSDPDDICAGRDATGHEVEELNMPCQ